MEDIVVSKSQRAITLGCLIRRRKGGGSPCPWIIYWVVYNITTQRRSEHLLNRVAWRILHYVGQNFILRFLIISHPIFNMNYLSIISIVHYLYDSFSALLVQYIGYMHASSYIRFCFTYSRITVRSPQINSYPWHL